MLDKKDLLKIFLFIIINLGITIFPNGIEIAQIFEIFHSLSDLDSKEKEDLFKFIDIKNIFCKIDSKYYIKSNPKKLKIAYLIELVRFLKENPNVKKKADLPNCIEQLMKKEEIINLESKKNKKKDDCIFELYYDNIEENPIEAIIRAKLYNELIEYYKKLIEKDKKNISQNMLREIENKNDEIIKNNINILIGLNLHYDEEIIKEKNIIEIYSDIILALIKNHIFKDFKFSFNIIKQLDLDGLCINKQIVENLYNIINEEKNNEDIKRYIIFKKEDFFDPIKINFNFLVLNWFSHHSFYKYSDGFLIETRQLILCLMKRNEFFFEEQDFKNEELKKRFIYILKAFCDSEYYFEYYFKAIPKEYIKKLGVILKYYNLFEAKKEDVQKIKNIIKYKMGYVRKYIKKYELAKLILHFFNSEEETHIVLTELEIEEKAKVIEKNILEKKLDSINDKVKQVLIHYFKNKENKKILCQKIGEEIFYYFINSVSLYLLLNESTIIFHVNNEEDNKIIFGQNNVMKYKKLKKIYNNNNNNNNNKDELQKFQFDKKLNEEFKCYFKFLEESKKIISDELKNNKLSIRLRYKKGSSCLYDFIDFYPKTNNKELEAITKKIKQQIERNSINEYSTIQSSSISNSNIYDEIIIKLSNGYLIVRKDNSYWILDNNLSKKMEIELENINFITERLNYEEKDIDNIQIIIIKKNDLYSLKINCKNREIEQKLIKVPNFGKYNFNNLFEINKNKFVGYSNNKIYIIEDLFSNTFEPKIIEEENKIGLLKVENELIFYDIKTKRNEIEGFTFNYSQKNIYLKDKKNVKKALICSCKNNKGKNGLLIKVLDREVPKFEETGNFEIYCFCPALEENQFLAGGFQENTGIIKSYSFYYETFEIKENYYKNIEGLPVEDILRIDNNSITYFQNKKIVYLNL